MCLCSSLVFTQTQFTFYLYQVKCSPQQNNISMLTPYYQYWTFLCQCPCRSVLVHIPGLCQLNSMSCSHTALMMSAVKLVFE